MQERLIQLLEAVAGAATPISANELLRLTRLPRATLYRNLAMLLDCGFLEEVEGGKRYVLGMRFVKIALTGKSDSHVVDAVAASMNRLVSDLGETAFLARYRGGRVDLVNIETPTDPAVAYVYPGIGTRPAHACSSAKAIAAFILPELRDELLSAQPIRFTDATLIDPDQIRAELGRVRSDGYAICDGEIDEGVSSVAVPVNVDRLGALFSIGVVGPSNRVKPALKDRILPVLQEENVRAAAAIQHCSIFEAESTHADALAAVREGETRAQ